jgi:hypothetical protein
LPSTELHEDAHLSPSIAGVTGRQPAAAYAPIRAILFSSSRASRSLLRRRRRLHRSFDSR